MITSMLVITYSVTLRMTYFFDAFNAPAVNIIANDDVAALVTVTLLWGWVVS